MRRFHSAAGFLIVLYLGGCGGSGGGDGDTPPGPPAPVPPPLGENLPGRRPDFGPREYVLFESDPVRPLALSAGGTRLFAVNTPDNRPEILPNHGAAAGELREGAAD